MTTAVSPWAEHDKKLRETYRRRAVAEQFSNLNGAGDDTLRECLKRVDAAKVELANIDEIIRGTTEAIDRAVAEHQATCGPLQSQLADPSTTGQHRIELRRRVIEANELLEATLAPLRKALEAAHVERESVRAAAGGRSAIEGAWVNGDTDENLLRARSIAKAVELLSNGPAFELRCKVDEAMNAVDWAKRQIDERSLYTGKTSPSDQALLSERREQLEKVQAVADVMNEWIDAARGEIADIRAKRLAKLYNPNNSL